MNQWETFNNIGAVQDELAAAAYSVGKTLRAVRVDATLLAESEYPLKPSHLRDCADNLELTYVLRLFSEYERALRDFWRSRRPRSKHARMRMEILMNRVAVDRKIPVDILTGAHDVGTYRNEIIHDHLRSGDLPFRLCKSQLSFFVSYLPRQW